MLVNNLKVNILVGIHREIIFFLPFLAYKKQCTLPCVKARIFQSFLNKLRFSGIQEAGKYIYRDLCHTISLYAKRLSDGKFIQI